MKKNIREAYISEVYDIVAERMADNIQEGNYYCIFGDYCDWAGIHGWEFLIEDYGDDDDLPWEPCLQEAKDELDALLEDGYDLILLSYSIRHNLDSKGKLADFLALDDSLMPAVRKLPYDDEDIAIIRKKLPFNKEFLDATLTKKKVNWLVAADWEGQDMYDAAAAAAAEAFEAAMANNN